MKLGAEKSDRPEHEESCSFVAGDPWSCNCRMYVNEVTVGCHAESLDQCNVCYAVVRSWDTDKHLDWHWKRGDFA